jgi:hypothetical protein
MSVCSPRLLSCFHSTTTAGRAWPSTASGCHSLSLRRESKRQQNMLKIRLKLTQKQRGLLQSVPTNRRSALHPLMSGLIVTYTLATSPLLFPACDDLLLGDPRMPLLKPLPAGKPLLPSCHTPRCMTVPFWTSMPHTAAREAQPQVTNIRAGMAG